MDRVRVDVSYPVQRLGSGAADDETNADIIRSYRLNAMACGELKQLLPGAWTDDLHQSLSACVGTARWRSAIQRATVAPQEMRRASVKLQRMRRIARELRESLSADHNYECLVFRSTLSDRGNSDDWLTTALATLEEIATTADAASQEVGVLTIGSDPDGSGGWVTAEPTHVIPGDPGRPAENSRNLLAKMAGSALARSGIAISKTRGGVFEQILGILLREGELFVPTDLHRTVVRAVDRIRWLQSRPSSRLNARPAKS